MKEVAHTDVTAHCRTTRAVNVLRTNGLSDSTTLLNRTMSDLRAIRNCGATTLSDIVQALLIAVAQAPHTSSNVGSEGPLEALFEIHPDTGTDHDQVATDDLVGLLDQWLVKLDGRELALFRHRLVVSDQTLADLGHQYGVSSERVRQIEAALRRRFDLWRQSRYPSRALSLLRNQTRDAVGVVRGKGRVVESIPVLGEVVETLSAPLVDLLPLLVPELCCDATWIASRPLLDLRDETRDRALHSGHLNGDSDDIQQFLRLAEDEWQQWIEYCDLELLGEVVVRAGATTGERARAVLRAAGKPMTAAQLTELIGHTSVRGVRNCLQADESIARLGRGIYGLPEWELETYEGIKEEIVQRIDRAGGRVRVGDVVDDLVKQFNVSAASVRACAYRREFAHDGEWLSLKGSRRSAGRPGRTTARMTTPAETRRCFHHDGSWWYRLDVGPDMLRGSGFPVPIGVMGLFQVADGTERILSVGAHSIRMSWAGSQPTFGSIRPILLELEAATGDVLWIAPGETNMAVIRFARNESTTAAGRLAHLVGLRQRLIGDALTQGVAAAIGQLTSPTWSSLASGLRARGDVDVAETIESVFGYENSSSNTFDDFLLVLRGN
jgi:hypothetical protein